MSIGTPPSGPGPAHAAIPQSDDSRLKKTALQLEGVFVQRLFAAMRDTVPTDGELAPSNAESTFTGMLDEKFAQEVPAQWSGQHSLAQALYQQLRQRLVAPNATPAAKVQPVLHAPGPTPNAIPR